MAISRVFSTNFLGLAQAIFPIEAGVRRWQLP